MSDAYLDFLKSKIEIAQESGFEVPDSAISLVLKPHQHAAVKWAIRGGCRALFESFGLGKSIQQLEICRIIAQHEGGRALIVCPLDVRLEFANDAHNLLNLPTRYVRNMAEIKASTEQVLITNYERVRDGDIDPSYFAVTSLDEASILRSFGSKTYQEFLPKFAQVPYRFVATATPSPNRYKELIHYAGYLGVMDTGQALTRFFQRDSSKANNLTLYPHKEDEFWLWVSTWALFITKPSDLGFDDAGYDLPPMDIRYHEIKVDHAGAGAERDGQMKLYRDASSGGLPAAAKEKRDSMVQRIAKAAEIINEAPDDHYLIWHDQDSERDEIKHTIEDVAIITGTGDLEERAERLHDFANGIIPRMATKKSISAAGGNFQRHCHRAIFVGIDHKFHDFIQAIYRIYRFMQPNQVRIDVIYTESERAILEDLKRKWTQHDRMVEKMIAIIKKYGLSAAGKEGVLQRHIGVKRVEIKTDLFTAVNNDCVEETTRMPDNSVGLICTSIPFANHYEYTPSYNDFGHTSGNPHFWAQMDFLTPQLLRILQPGRIAAIHVKDRILFGNTTGDGMPTCDSFHEETSLHFQRHGFKKIGMITVDTDVVRENNQTYRLGWTEQCKDGSKMGVGCPEYILLFRKLPSDKSTAYADVPVVKSKEEYPCSRWQLDAHAHWRSSGDRLLTPDEIAALPIDGGAFQAAYRKYSRDSIYNYHEHLAMVQRLEESGKLPKIFMVAAPASINSDIWDDINRMRTLNTAQSMKGRQLHVCPLQLDIVERIITRYSNKGDVVMDPFGGIMTVPYMALKLGRRGYGIELNHDYFRDGVGYLKAAEEEMAMPTLFDFMEAA
ncbi:DNA methylase N-4 [Oryzomonas sagensis]|uniref:DNA methylase N-4 n=1 Tax=Oryzomonas sagensis TaxID=2603857 RepID=A0ABQ6TL16_9BACT|nr:DNA methyltransferase [Oryzomonas sagensis]KAB0668965.1 DNA methylase N-4 [Oryzomonas sagensis]